MKDIIKQAFKFFGVSGIGWIIDMCIFIILTSFSISEIIANILSAFVAITFVYCVSTRKLFINKNENFNLKKKYIMYIVYQIIIVSVASFAIGLLNKGILSLLTIKIITNYSKIIAKILVTPFTMILNFLFMKFLIERV